MPIFTLTPEPVEISETRVYMDRGLTMATFGLYCAGLQEKAREPLALPDSLRVAVQLEDGTVVEAIDGEELHCSIHLRLARQGGGSIQNDGWTVDKADLPKLEQEG